MQGKAVHLNQVSMKFGEFTAVHTTSLTIEAGVFYSILGPSGCGKTTLLRMVSGFLQPTSGEVIIGDKVMNNMGPNHRPTAMIFQNLALFPLMSVAENIAYGLRVQGMGKKVRLKKADELLELVALQGQGDKKPNDLSGGQRQRVAIARALAVDPAILLLDEPLSALDLKLRQHMRNELKQIQRETGVTFIYITHDQGEALTMSDQVAVMNKGRIEQVGDASTIYNQPKGSFVASFVGENNLISGKVIEINDNKITLQNELGVFSGVCDASVSFNKGDDAFLFIRPEQNLINDKAKHCDNQLQAKFSYHDMEGAFYNLHFQTKTNQAYTVHTTNTGQQSLSGDVTIGFHSSDARVVHQGALADE